ncbi:MAG: ATP-dependent RecD-like DNA helicase [Pseudomonadota bacterium]
MQITAHLEYVAYSNGNNFLIGKFNHPDQGVFSALGTLSNPQTGMEYELHGEFTTHPKYGKQFSFSNCRMIQPTDESGIYYYLIRMVKGVGSSIAQDLVDEYGDDTLHILRTDPKRVAGDISGITLLKAQKIQKQLIDIEMEEAVMVELLSILTIPGLRKSLPADLIEKYGYQAAETIRVNPYLLTEFRGVGFMTADRIALQCIGIDPGSMDRARAAVIHIIKEEFRNGHTWVKHTVIEKKLVELGVGTAGVEDAVFMLEESGDIVTINDGDLLTTKKMDDNENVIAKGMKNAFKS